MKIQSALIDRLDEYTLNGEPLFTRKPDNGFSLSVGNCVKHSGQRSLNDSFKIETDNGILFFKQENNFHSNISIITGEIANALGMKVVAPVKATLFYTKENIDDNKLSQHYQMDGVIMNSFSDTSDDAEIITPLKFKNLIEYSKEQPSNFPSIYESMSAIAEMKTLDEFKDVKFDDEIVYDLMKIAIFDFLTLQPDRHPRNIEFLFREFPAGSGKFTFESAPMFDTSLAFEPHTCKSRTISLKNYTNLVAQFDELPRVFNGILRLESESVCFKSMMNRKTPDEIENQLRQESFSALGNMAKVIVCNPKMREFYNDIMDLDIKKLVNEIYEKHNLSPFIMKEFLYIRDAFDNQRLLLHTAVKVEEIKRAETIQKNTVKFQTKNQNSN